MTLKSFLTPAAALALLGSITFVSCSKNAKPLDQPQLAPTTAADPAGGGRRVQWDVTLPATANSGAMEVTEWISFQTGEINTGVTTSVDPGYVMVGGGAQVGDPGGNAGAVNAILTAAYPINDGTFSTYAGSDKDHGGIFYTSDLYVYVIGIKLFAPGGTAIPTSTVIPHLHLYSVTSSPAADHPFQYASVSPGYPGYRILSGGALDNYGTGYGNLLTEDDYQSIYPATSAYASGKDQKVADPSTITAFALAIDTTAIAGYGHVQVGYNTSTVTVTNHLQGLTVSILGNYAVAGVGGYSQSSGYGRLLYGMYSYSSTTGQFQSKDQDVSDVSGSLSGVVTYIAPQ